MATLGHRAVVRSPWTTPRRHYVFVQFSSAKDSDAIGLGQRVSGSRIWYAFLREHDWIRVFAKTGKCEAALSKVRKKVVGFFRSSLACEIPLEIRHEKMNSTVNGHAVLAIVST